jgi:hypothetical protein
MQRIIGRYRVARRYLRMGRYEALRWALPAHWSRPIGWL